MGKFKGVPGRVEFKMEIVDEADERHQTTSPDGHVIALPTLAAIRQRFGGDEIELQDARGDKHRISLKQYAHLDPNKTHVLVTETFVPDHPFRKEHEALLKDPEFDKRRK